MEKRVKQIRLIKTITVCLTAAFYVVTWGDLKAWQMAITFVIAGMVFLLGWIYERYEDDLLAQLSELIGSLTDKNRAAMFSDVEDSLLSKLQSQVSKLSGILEAQNLKAQEDKENLQALISDLSHQLKTPVTSVQMFGELLKKEDLSQRERQEYNEILQHSLEKLVFLTDSMIKVSRMEVGMIQLKYQTVTTEELSLAAIKQVYAKAMDKGIDIALKGEGQQITADPSWSVEALVNILDNGIKYCPYGSHITISYVSYEFYVAICITDDGPGICEEEQAKIFQRFYRGRAAGIETETTKGVGIGLYLARQILRQQDGYIKVKSDGTSGSTFSLYFPKQQSFLKK